MLCVSSLSWAKGEKSHGVDPRATSRTAIGYTIPIPEGCKLPATYSDFQKH